MIQQLKSFDNAESAVFTADGKYVLVSNAAELGRPDRGFHFVEHGGFISKLEVQPGGKLKMVNRKLIEGMTGPLGMAVLPKATKMFPAGTIFVCKGNLPMAEPDGTPITDSIRLTSEIIAFDVNGRLLGAISWGRHSYLEQVSGAPATQPNGMAFDKEGNLYVAETGVGGDSLIPPMDTVPGVMMVPHGAIDDLASERRLKEKPLFIPIPGGPAGVAVCPTDQSIYVNTVGLAAGVEDPDKGATFRLRKSDFVAGVCPKPIASGFGALDGLAFLPDGTRLETQVLYEPHYIMVTIPGGKAMRVPLEPNVRFTACAGIAVRQMSDGSYLLVVPQLSPLAPNLMKDEVTVVKLPKEFGTIPAKKPRAEKKTTPPKKPVRVREKPKSKPKAVKANKVKTKAAAPQKKAKVKTVAPRKLEPEPEKVKTKPAPTKERSKAKVAEPKASKPEPKKVETKAISVKGKPEAKKAEPKQKKEKKRFLFFFSRDAKKKREDRKKKKKGEEPFLFFFKKPAKKEAELEQPKAEPGKAEKPKPEKPEQRPVNKKKGSVLRETKPMEIKPRLEENKPTQQKSIPAAPSKAPAKPEENKNKK
ncbi:MAG: hypothetical protein GXP25_19145 [Planctomycetes bacterium]|nr:hypothetical protein [Planctomycetota bacterium]